MHRLMPVAFLFACACTVHKSDLAGTLEWMDNTYNPRPEIAGSYGRGRAEWFTVREGSTDEILAAGRMYSFTYSGCSMKVKSEPDPTGDDARIVMTSYVSSFALGDVDLSSVEVKAKSHRGDFVCNDDPEQMKTMNCDHAALYFSTRNSLGLITEVAHSATPGPNAEQQPERTIKSSTLFLEFNDPAYGKRFAKAFVHAIELCGGKRSKF